MEPQKPVEAGTLRTEEDAYRQAFTRFLAGTDEKSNTHAYLRDMVGRLHARQVFLDVGSADGTTTRYLAPYFERTVCIEPSEPMRRVLQRACPQAEVVGEPVMEARIKARADLALLSHVLYYVPRTQWVATVSRIMRWLAPGGLLLVLLQNPDEACMRMVRHFTGARFDLRELADELAALPPGLISGIELDTVPASYRSSDLDETVATAAFHLSIPGTPAPRREAVEAYVREHLRNREGEYVLRHDQHALRLQRSPS
ncbi:class I SAM-dependent methyltransferase [Streptomyces huasconensis]|uniref:class I SAM-dependent methyltransferase n=1 Tax=Streptomyces huasconensis TaxID=1854574 RepID=UPI001E65B04A|nr:class I SAM-dependent methyltransferase [Streptomyces huasconensis]UFQ19872.1 class I SAM-dependent methyltransferase [Streptomyces huasconensis]